MLRRSASYYKNIFACGRLHLISYIFGVRGFPNVSSMTGTVIHANMLNTLSSGTAINTPLKDQLDREMSRQKYVYEKRLKKGNLIPSMRQALEAHSAKVNKNFDYDSAEAMLGHGMKAMKALEGLDASRLFIEQRVEDKDTYAQPVIGFIDALYQGNGKQPTRIIDIKTTKFPRYALTADQLYDDIQATVYAALYPQLPGDTGDVSLEWIYVSPKGHFTTQANITRVKALERLRLIDDAANIVVDTHQPNYSHCDKYGGCIWRQWCMRESSKIDDDLTLLMDSKQKRDKEGLTLQSPNTVPPAPPMPGAPQPPTPASAPLQAPAMPPLPQNNATTQAPAPTSLQPPQSVAPPSIQAPAMSSPPPVQAPAMAPPPLQAPAMPQSPPAPQQTVQQPPPTVQAPATASPPTVQAPQIAQAPPTVPVQQPTQPVQAITPAPTQAPTPVQTPEQATVQAPTPQPAVEQAIYNEQHIEAMMASWNIRAEYEGVPKAQWISHNSGSHQDAVSLMSIVFLTYQDIMKDGLPHPWLIPFGKGDLVFLRYFIRRWKSMVKEGNHVIGSTYFKEYNCVAHFLWFATQTTV